MFLLRVRLRSEGRVAIPSAWFGAIKARCDTAELAATTWACRWCIYRMCVEPSMCGLPVALHVDSQHAISSVNGHVRPAVNGEAVHFARVALETFSLVTVECTAGHIGHPWNELADAAAKQAAHNPEMSATRYVRSVGPLLSHRQLDWFSSSAGLVFSSASFPEWQNAISFDAQHEELLSSVELARGDLSACVVSKCQYLSPSDVGVDGPTLSVTGRILAVQSQFAQCGLQIVGIQEGSIVDAQLEVSDGTQR